MSNTTKSKRYYVSPYTGDIYDSRTVKMLEIDAIEFRSKKRAQKVGAFINLMHRVNYIESAIDRLQMELNDALKGE